MDAEPISQMVEALGSLLRITLSRNSASSVIKSELDIVKDYMDIIQVRFGERIEYEVEVPEELYLISIPRLTLQPLVGECDQLCAGRDDRGVPYPDRREEGEWKRISYGQQQWITVSGKSSGPIGKK